MHFRLGATVSDKDELGKTAPRLSAVTPPKAEDAREPLPIEPEGRYAVPDGVSEPELGRGGMGRVLQLTDTHLRREVAVKELLPQHTAEKSSMGVTMETLFVREARVLARLEHPGVVPVYELGRRPDGTPYYTMRRIHGRPLSKVLDACASLDDRLALLQHYLHVVQAVGFAHSRGVVHRDLKPENVMVSGFGETQVIDWGLAVVDGVPPEGGVSAGTPAYMAPEQAAGTHVDARSDVWSLGVMLYELLTGELPFKGPSVAQVLDQVRTAPLPKVTHVESKAPPALVKVVEKALQRDAGLRYPDAGAMADALEAAMRARLPRSTGWLAAVMTLSALLLVVTAWTFRLSSRAEELLAKKQGAVDEAKRAEGEAQAQAGLAALRAKDTLKADVLARQAVASSASALGHGVLLLAAEQGVPERQWTARVPAGCSGVAVVGDAVACSTLNGVSIFSAQDGAPLGELSIGPLGWQHGVAALPGGRLASGGDDLKVHVWDVGARKEVAAWPVAGRITALASDGDEVVVGLRGGEVLRLTSTGEARTVDTHPGPVRVVAGGGGSTASASSGLLRLHLGADSAELDRVVGALAFLDGRHVVAGVERAVVRFEGLATQSISAGRDDVRALTLLPGVEGKRPARLVSGDASGLVRWYFDDGSLEGELDAFAPGVQALASTADGALVVATTDKSLEVWTLPPRAAPPIGDGVPTVHAVFPRGWLVMGTRDGRIRRKDLTTQEEATLELRHTQAVRGLAEVPGLEAPDALRLLSGGDDGLVKAQRWNGAVEVLDSRPAQKVTALAVADDGKRAAWAYDDGTWVLWSLEFGKEIARGQASTARAVAFAPDGRTLALGREDKRVVLLDAEGGKEKAVFEPLDAAVTALSFAPGAAFLVGGSADGRVTTWDVAGSRVVQRWSEARSRVSTVDVSPDGKLVAAGSDDGETLLWDAAGGRLLARVPADAGDALVVSFLGPQELVSVGTDRVVHRWTIATGK
ncbi:MAG: serine/threonine-protein kinase [Myxococcota bacterium]